MFIRSKVVKGHTYYQVVEGYRTVKGKVRQSNIVGLGRDPTILDALATAERRLAEVKELRAIWDRDGYAESHPDDESVMQADRKVADALAKVKLLRQIAPEPDAPPPKPKPKRVRTVADRYIYRIVILADKAPDLYEQLGSPTCDAREWDEPRLAALCAAYDQWKARRG